MTPPIAARATIKLLGILLKSFHVLQCRRCESYLGELFRVDAKAEGDDVVWIGGWSTSPSAMQAKWFSCRVDSGTFPWVFERGQPFKVIGALELLAVLCGIYLLFPQRDHKEGLASVWFAAGTDTQSK